MKVLFVYPVVPPNYDTFGIQQGIAAISAVLKEGGHDTRLYSDYEFRPAALDEVVESFRPGLVGIHATYPQSDLVLQIAEHLGARHSLKVIIGGVWPTTQGDEAIASPHITDIARGEAEHSLLDLANALERDEPCRDLAGFWFRGNGEVIRNPARPYTENLDNLPFPDRTIFEGQKLLGRLPYLEFIGQRGCPFRCSNCFHHSWRNNTSGAKDYVRYKSPARLVEEIKHAYPNHAPKGEPCMGFHDATFTLNRAWTFEVCDLLRKEVGIPWWCNTRASNMDEELADALKQGGCFEVHIGIESGDEHIRNDVLRKNVKNEQIVHAFEILRDRGLQTFGFNMLGLPHETEEAMIKTVELNRRVKPDTIFCSVFSPFPGTDLHDLVVEKGWLSDRQVNSYFDHTSVLDQPSVDARTVAHYHKFFRLMVKNPWLATVLRPLDKVRLGDRTLYDFIDAQFGQSGFWRKRLSRAIPPSAKRVVKKLLRL